MGYGQSVWDPLSEGGGGGVKTPPPPPPFRRIQEKIDGGGYIPLPPPGVWAPSHTCLGTGLNGVRGPGDKEPCPLHRTHVSVYDGSVSNLFPPLRVNRCTSVLFHQLYLHPIKPLPCI